MVKVLFVCIGNICRLHTAEAVFAAMPDAGPVGHILIDSAGTHDYHIGEPSDSRTHRAALQRGHDMGGLRGRQVEEGDVRRFDYALAMDKANLAILQRLAPPTGDTQMRLFLEYAAEGLLQDIG